jgi:hypothetical protein
MTQILDRGGRVIRAATPQTSSSAYPLGPPTIGADGTISVENMLEQPTRITRMIQDMSLQRWLLDIIFTSAGGVTGGAVIYDVPDENDIYSDRDVQRVQPGSEYPIVTSSMPIPKMAEVEKWGGKVFITDEARDRNSSAKFTMEIRKLTNTIVRKLNQVAVVVVNANFTSYPTHVVPGNNWTNVNIQGTSPTPLAQQPIADFAKIQLLEDQEELGNNVNYIILNPQEAYRLGLIYGQDWEAVLNLYYPAGHYVSNRQPAGTALVFEAGNVGELRVEKPLGTETWREEKTERTWVQASVRPVMYVTNPFATWKLTGLAG